MDFKWTYASENAQDAFAVRTEVFVHEQGFSITNELDEKDEISWHLIGYNDNGDAVCAARLFSEHGNIWHAGRIAVKKSLRGQGVGKKLIQEIKQKAIALGAVCIELGAQYDKVPFYEKCGFVSTGEQYLDEGYPHVQMKCKLALL
ncbi:MAG: GNAT family N-acetyltransferase [Oscillospiraceae bacterium]